MLYLWKPAMVIVKRVCTHSLFSVFYSLLWDILNFSEIKFSIYFKILRHHILNCSVHKLTQLIFSFCIGQCLSTLNTSECILWYLHAISISALINIVFFVTQLYYTKEYEKIVSHQCNGASQCIVNSIEFYQRNHELNWLHVVFFKRFCTILYNNVYIINLCQP